MGLVGLFLSSPCIQTRSKCSKSLCRGKQKDQSVKQALLPMPLSLPPVPLLMVPLSMLLHLSLLMKIDRIQVRKIDDHKLLSELGQPNWCLWNIWCYCSRDGLCGRLKVTPLSRPVESTPWHSLRTRYHKVWTQLISRLYISLSFFFWTTNPFQRHWWMGSP